MRFLLSSTENDGPQSTRRGQRKKKVRFWCHILLPRLVFYRMHAHQFLSAFDHLALDKDKYPMLLSHTFAAIRVTGTAYWGRSGGHWRATVDWVILMTMVTEGSGPLFAGVVDQRWVDCKKYMELEKKSRTKAIVKQQRNESTPEQVRRQRISPRSL